MDMCTLIYEGSMQLLTTPSHRERLIEELYDISRSASTERLEYYAAIQRAPVSPSYKEAVAHASKLLCDLDDEPLVRAFEHELELLAKSRRQFASRRPPEPQTAFSRTPGTLPAQPHLIRL